MRTHIENQHKQKNNFLIFSPKRTKKKIKILNFQHTQQLKFCAEFVHIYPIFQFIMLCGKNEMMLCKYLPHFYLLGFELSQSLEKIIKWKIQMKINNMMMVNFFLNKKYIFSHIISIYLHSFKRYWWIVTFSKTRRTAKKINQSRWEKQRDIQILFSLKLKWNNSIYILACSNKNWRHIIHCNVLFKINQIFIQCDTFFTIPFFYFPLGKFFSSLFHVYLHQNQQNMLRHFVKYNI